MSKLNERLTLIANLSVVVGIVFLAVEPQQPDKQSIRVRPFGPSSDRRL